MDKQQFLMTYNISEKELAEANISWEELAQIMDEYRGIEGKLRDLGKSMIWASSSQEMLASASSFSLML